MKLVAVVAMDERGGIGHRGGLPWHLPADLAHFKRLTVGKPCVMGRGVWDSLGRRPLPGRPNIVLSRTLQAATGAAVARTPEEALREAAKHGDEVAIIGGAQVYELFAEELTAIELTRVHGVFDADTFWKIPDGFEVVEEVFRPADEKNLVDMSFLRLERR